MMAGTSPDSLPPRKFGTLTMITVVLALLLGLWIFGLTIWHGADSPFNTPIGKAAFIGIFALGPIYVHARLSKFGGFALLMLSIVLWATAPGQEILFRLMALLAGD